MQRFNAICAVCTVVLAVGCQKSTSPPTPNDQRPPNPRVEGAGDDVQIKVTPVAGNVYMLEGRGGNIGVSVGEDGVLMIDDQFAPLAPRIRDAVAGIAKAKGDIEFVLNTHFHGDHTGGNPVFGKKARIVAHTNVRKRLTTDQTWSSRGTMEALPKEGWPVITFDKAVTIHFNGEAVNFIHMPTGHTDGDSIVHFPQSNVIHMGDLFFPGRFPIIDLEHGGDVDNLIAGLEKVMAMVPADIKIIPGHGSLATLDDLKTYHRVALETTNIVRQHIAAGKNLEQIIAAGLPAKYESWGTGFFNTEQWLTIIHISLTR